MSSIADDLDIDERSLIELSDILNDMDAGLLDPNEELVEVQVFLCEDVRCLKCDHT